MLDKVSEGDGQTAIDLIASGEIHFVVNTPQGRGPRSDGEHIRKAANTHRVSTVTTIAAALAAAHGLSDQCGQTLRVRSLQEYLADGLDWPPLRFGCSRRRLVAALPSARLRLDR